MSDLYKPLDILESVTRTLDLRYERVNPIEESPVKVSQGKQHFFAGVGSVGMYPLNSHFGTAIAKDKAWTNLVLKAAGFKIISGKHFFLNPEWKEYQPAGQTYLDALNYAAELGYPVFVKPNSLSSGRLAEIITTQEELEAHLKKINSVESIALIQQIVQNNEFRLFVVDGKVKFVYQREPAKVVGDGVKTVEELIAELNDSIPVEKHKLAVDAPIIKLELAKKQLGILDVLPQGESLQVTAHANLATGGQIMDYQEQVPTAVGKWAAQVAETLGLRVCGIDVFARSIQAESPQDWTIIEVNNNPNLRGIYEAGYVEMAEQVWIEILEKFFGEVKGKGA